MAADRAPALDARGITVELGGRTVLRDAALHIAAGEVVAVLAPSGAGKSTLLRAIVGLSPATGTVTVDGADAATLAPTAVRRRVAFVAQTPVMLPGTVEDNLAHGLPDLSSAARDDALAAAGLDATFADRPAGELSGGERARVALARALTRGPRVLLLDEPTAALDHAAAEVIGATLRRLAGLGLGIALATHDEAFATRWSDRQVRL